jgi:hypothetical protein
MRISRFFPGNWVLISEAKNGVPEVRYGLKRCEVARQGIQRRAMMDNRESRRKQITLLIIAWSFSILIVAENVPHAGHRLLTIFSSPPEPQTSLVVGAYVFLPLALLWASWANLRKGKHPLVSFPIAACVIFLTMDYLLPYPGPVKKTF